MPKRKKNMPESSKSPNKGEIFRHLRPMWFNRGRGVIAPRPSGGLSFLFLPNPDVVSQYHYWIYICPDDAAFSAKVAVSKLREVASRGVMPWGTITLDENPLLDVALKDVLAEKGELPTKVAHHAFKMIINNLSTTRLHELYVAARSNAKVEYANEER